MNCTYVRLLAREYTLSYWQFYANVTHGHTDFGIILVMSEPLLANRKTKSTNLMSGFGSIRSRVFVSNCDLLHAEARVHEIHQNSYIIFFQAIHQLGGDKEATNVRQCRQQTNKQQLDRAELRHLDRDRYNAAADKQITVATSMTSSSSHDTSHLKRKIDESAKAAAKAVVNNKDDFYATSNDSAAHDRLRSVVAQPPRPPTIVNLDGDDRTTATACNANMNTM